MLRASGYTAGEACAAYMCDGPYLLTVEVVKAVGAPQTVLSSL